MKKKIFRKILPKKFFDYIYDLFYMKFYKIFHNFNHELKPEFNSALPNIKFSNINFFDLQDGLEIDLNNFSKNSLITCINRKKSYPKNDSFIFESWVSQNKTTYSDSEIFLITQKRKIYESFKKKNIKYYNKKIFLLPYYVNQAGHFMGENIGAILFFLELLKKRKKKEKLLIITPSKNWNNFFKKFYKDNIVLFKENFFIKNNIVFSNSQVFPKFSTYQNYIIAKNILSKKIENDNFKNKKFFLCSGRVERIINVKECIAHLKKNNFIVLDPSKISIIRLFRLLNSAKCVISESASISHNIHLARNKEYYLLLSKKDKFTNSKWQRLTTDYNNFHTSLYKPIFCDTVSSPKLLSLSGLDPKSKIPLTSQIKVDLKKLNNL